MRYGKGMMIDPNQPQVMAAIVGGCVAAVVSVTVAVTNQLSLRSMHKQKLDGDRDLAERKVNADIALAERKFQFDKDLVSWRRRYELAEQVLAAAYEARDALNWARGPGIRQGEGQSRIAIEPESQAIKEARDSAFVPIERLAAHSKAFAALQTLRDAVMAHFGDEAAKPISEIFEVYHGITVAASMLMENAAWNEDRQARASLQPIRDELYGDKAKAANAKANAAVKQLETFLRPILSAGAPV